ncbi:MAG: cysteine--tRNA ligase [Propionibacteriaceae bacterium]
MTFRLYDSATREVRDLETVVPGRVSIYHCGLTVQSSPHLGHIRKEVVFDVLRRWLTASGLHVTVVANVTDIDDKILAKSAEAGVPWFAHAYTFERELHKAYRALGCEQPTYEPRATGHIPEMLTMVSELIERGHAYVATDGSGDVYFDVLSWPSYGELSHQRVDDMVPAEDSDPRGKRDPRDFALWKGYKPTEPVTASWPAPWGRGRPGWHLECSAMAIKYLGDEFDIHGGGIDLRFPHHENELAQARASGHPFARYWMHNAWVTAAGEKMSKSLLNGALVSEVTAQYPARAVRFYLAVPHYRSSIEYSSESLKEATASLARIDGFVDRAVELVGGVETSYETLPAGFVAALDDDLGTSTAMAEVYELVRVGNQALTADDADAVRSALVSVQSMLDVFGLRADDPVWQGGDDARLRPILDGVIAELLEQRQAARARKDFAAADSIRNRLTGLGVVVEDTPNGPRWSV